MNNERSTPQTIESLALEVRRLSERLEDLEDLMELRAAVERNQGQPGTPWEKVKPELWKANFRSDNAAVGVGKPCG
jgi:hypothetical protein